MDFSIGYREIVPDQTNSEKWLEITLNTGGSQSTLQDFKVAERSGGMHYRDQGTYYTRNRFIYWRTCNQILELVEESLDITLLNNRVRYRFTDTPVLEGVTVCEVPGAVLVLVPTVSSVHRLSFPHPDVIHNKGQSYPRAGVEYTAFSIFADANVTAARNPSAFHVINSTYSNCAAPLASASGMSASGQDCLFALAYPNGNILLVTMNIIHGNTIVQLDPHADALMPRFLSKAFRSKTNEDAVSVSMALQSFDGETYLFCLCRDGNVRAWSTHRHQSTVVTEFPSNLNQGAQCHSLRTTIGTDGELYVGVYHCYPFHSSIKLLRALNAAPNQLKLTCLDTIEIREGRDVVDFVITGNREVWMIERSAAGETAIILHHNGEFFNCELDTRWETAEVPVDPDMEPKQAYLDFLFYPGRFPISVINKALSIYRKLNVMSDVAVLTQVLKERVSAVVDAQIYGEMREREFSAEEALALQNSAWQKFYSCVMEYYESGTRPLGLVVSSHKVVPTNRSVLHKSGGNSSMTQDMDEAQDGELVTSGVVVIKKSYISLIRPMDPIESLILNEGFSQSAQQVGVSADLVRLVSVLAYLDDNLPEDGKFSFEKGLKQLKTPLLTVSELFAKDLSCGDEDTMTSMDLLNNLAMNVEEFNDLAGTISGFLDLLDVGQPELDDGSVTEKSKWLLHLGHLYGSQLGMSFAATSLHQIIYLRFQLCRSLLILVQMVKGHSFRQYLSRDRHVDMPADLAERTSQLIQCYNLLLWISQTPIHSLQFIESVENSASILKLNEGRNPLLVPQQNNTTGNISILHLFLKSSASALVRLLLSRQDIPMHLLPVWKHSFLPFVQVLIQLLWPKCNNTIFPEFLLLSCQYLHVQEYTRLLSKWCHSNIFTRKFLLACSLLDMGEHEKAFELFDIASHGVLVDDFIRRRVAKSSIGTDSSLTVSYFSQVIKLFEQQGLHNLVVELASKAIAAAKGDEPELATLHSVSFLHQLRLGRDKAAYEALLANPDSERRKNCLQQLVVTLVDAKRLNILLEFNFDGVRRELERIVDARARSLEVAGNPYYSFAYAYHVSRGSMRKAGCVMYEQALRLSSEGTLEALQKQCQCYVAAITALSLVKKDDAWIVKPLPVDDPMDTSEVMDEFGTMRKVEVLEINDLVKELALCKSRVKLATFSPEHGKTSSLASHNANELVGLLTHAGLFKDALHLADLFGVPKASVLSGLAGLCVSMDETPNDLAWDWLQENEASDLGDGSAAGLAWRLLEILLRREEVGRESSLHRAVTSKLIHLGVFLPLWLVTSYKKRNASELLRLLLSAGRLEEASELGVEYIEAVLGKGKDRFALETSLMPQEPSVWLPLNTLDMILLELKDHSNEDECYKEGYERLNKLLDQYTSVANRCSDDKIKLIQDEIARARVVSEGDSRLRIHGKLEVF